MADPRADSAVGACLDILAAHQAGVIHDALGYQFRVLDEICGVGDHPRHEHLAGGQFHILPHVVLVCVSHVGRFDGVLLGIDLEQ